MKKILSTLIILIFGLQINAQQKGCISGDCDNGYGTWVYDNGDKYEGSWVNKKMHGAGTYYYKNGDLYKGDFRDNKLEGTGTFTSVKGDKYTGEYVNNLAEGEGTYYYANGKVEQGLWLKGQYAGNSDKKGCVSGDCVNGKGTYIFDNGEKYIGDIKNGQREGKGTYYFGSGEWYSGDWSKNQRNGQGINYFPDGEKYEGNWKNDLRHGYGTHTYLDGKTKTGMWELGRFVGSGNNNYGCISGNCDNGYGVFRWQDGQKYVGTFKNKLRYGKGTNYWPDGKIYEGVWLNDQMNGFGIESMGDPLPKTNNNEKNLPLLETHIEFVKDGFWEAGKYVGKDYPKSGCVSGNCNTGYGTFIQKSGDRYIGQFKNNQYNGYGTLDYIRGGRYVGEFKNGKFEGQGNLKVLSKGRFIGQFAGGLYDGIGTFYYDNGRIEAGKWKTGKFSGTAQIGLKVPETNWLSPTTASITTTNIDYTIRLGIKSKEVPQNIQVFINDELKADNAINGLKKSEADYDFVLERSFTLKPGANNFKIIVKNGAGEVTSNNRIITYDDNQNKMTKRYALVIGNSNYSIGTLRNPQNDAKAMAATLQSLGFEVAVYFNLGQEEMKTRIREFGDKITANKGVGLFFYAGHGLQVGGENYIIPVDAHIAKFEDIENEAVNLNRITGEMAYAKNDLNIIILDACRNNPFAGEESGGKGLASTPTPSGSFLAFATAPGSVAADGTGNNGLYTQEILKAIVVPNTPIEDIFKEVRRNVYKLSNQQQTPWENSSIFDDFYFKKQ
jgi:hypothetical protein